MANHKGSEGVVHIGTTAIAELKSWSLSVSAATIDTSLLSSTWAGAVAGKNSWSGSCECFWDETDTNGQEALTPGASVVVKFYAEGATTGDVYYTGTVIVTGIERSAGIDGMVEASFSFTGDGVLTRSVTV